MSYEDILKQNLSEASCSNINKWLTEAKYSEYRDELVYLIEAGRWRELEDAFFKDIEFGTGGRRGHTGIGSARINRVTIGESAQALCSYLKSVDIEAVSKGVVIAYDTRLTSLEFGKYVARVCAANGFKTYIFDSFRSTPELSFAIRQLKTAAGVVISASHNPSTDNGFKAYWSDGGQLVSPYADNLIEAVRNNTEILSVDYDEALSRGEIIEIGQDIDNLYVDYVVGNAEGEARDLNIVYSPLHGTGQTNTLPVLRKAGFGNVSLIQEQMTPDGNFPNVKGGKPNPELVDANEMVISRVLEQKADIGVTNDPDADRLGIVVRNKDDILFLNGNQIAVLVADYVLEKRKQKGVLPAGSYIAKTIVTTDLLNAIARNYDVKVYSNLLVGFKYISELIRSKETTEERFILGCEESHGILKGDGVRDKDAASASLAIAESAAELKQQGKTLFDRLIEIYIKYGLYVENLVDVYFEGADGFSKMQSLMERLQKNPIAKVYDHNITAVLNYNTLERKVIETGEISKIDCIKGNVTVFEFDNNPHCRVTVRPSGTEPKIKLYLQMYEAAKSENIEEVIDQYNNFKQYVDDFAQAIKNILLE